MKIDTPLHTDHQLDQLAGQFARWRQTRPHPHSPIPSEPLGPRGGVDRGRTAVARGHTVAVASGGPQQADRHPAGGVHADTSHLLRLCGSTAALTAPDLSHAPD